MYYFSSSNRFDLSYLRSSYFEKNYPTSPEPILVMLATHFAIIFWDFDLNDSNFWDVCCRSLKFTRHGSIFTQLPIISATFMWSPLTSTKISQWFCLLAITLHSLRNTYPLFQQCGLQFIAYLDGEVSVQPFVCSSLISSLSN